jgi:hypothetical protein
VKHDEDAAQVARDMAEGVTSSRGGGDDASSQHSLDMRSTTSSRGGGFLSKLRVKRADTAAMRTLRTRLSLATGALVALALALFLSFNFMMATYEEDVFKQYAAGVRRTLLTDTATHTRRTWTAALENNTSLFESSRAAIALRADTIWRSTGQLENLKRPDDVDAAGIYTPTARMRVAEANGSNTI